MTPAASGPASLQLPRRPALRRERHFSGVPLSRVTGLIANFATTLRCDRALLIDLDRLDAGGVRCLRGCLKDVIHRGGKRRCPAEAPAVPAQHPDALQAPVAGTLRRDARIQRRTRRLSCQAHDPVRRSLNAYSRSPA